MKKICSIPILISISLLIGNEFSKNVIIHNNYTLDVSEDSE
ncbi:MAG: hypothetical protein WD577_14620 [Bacteroidales bacterium]